MRNNPRGDWKIEDCESLCRTYDIAFLRMTGSHVTVSHANQREICTIVYGRPIKAVYIKKLVQFVDAVIARAAELDALTRGKK